MRALAFVLLLASNECDQNVTRTKPAENAGDRFLLEASATIGGTQTVYVLRDKANGKILYVTPGAGVHVEED